MNNKAYLKIYPNAMGTRTIKIIIEEGGEHGVNLEITPFNQEDPGVSGFLSKAQELWADGVPLDKEDKIGRLRTELQRTKHALDQVRAELATKRSTQDVLSLAKQLAETRAKLATANKTLRAMEDDRLTRAAVNATTINAVLRLIDEDDGTDFTTVAKLLRPLVATDPCETCKGRGMDVVHEQGVGCPGCGRVAV